MLTAKRGPPILRHQKTEFLKLEEESTLPPLKVKEGMEEKQQEVARLAVRSWTARCKKTQSRKERET